LAQEACHVPDSLPPAPANPHVILGTNFGNITVEVFLEQVPRTAQNFLRLARTGFYNGTLFDRVTPGFRMEGGDSASRGAGNATSGAGGPGYAIPDEFHWHLRHDHKGVLSMSNNGPNTGGSGFFITFAPTPWLDDHNAVFGTVVSGMDVLDAISAQAGDRSGIPKVPVQLQHARIVLAGNLTDGPAPSLDVSSPDGDHSVPAAGGETQYLVVAHNGTDRALPVCVEFPDLPEGVQARTEAGYDNFPVPADQRVAFVVQARSGSGAPDNATFSLRLHTTGADTTLHLTLRRSSQVTEHRPLANSTVIGSYIGMTADGRIFDTSLEYVAKYASDHHLGYTGFTLRSSYPLYTFSPGTVAAPGFRALWESTDLGGKSAGRVLPRDAYGTTGPSPLAGRILLLQVQVLAIR
jgi:cyclophilin family peptidyl-prolyl cis-trans isomerase